MLAHWVVPTEPLLWFLILVMGAIGGAGHFAIAHAYRYATAGKLGPFLYQKIIYMTFFGWLVFNQLPDWQVITGTSIVVLSGLYLLLHEMKQQD
jgi:drug/metabolite transporter (DMT)-like permease